MADIIHIKCCRRLPKSKCRCIEVRIEKSVGIVRIYRTDEKGSFVSSMCASIDEFKEFIAAVKKGKFDKHI